MKKIFLIIGLSLCYPISYQTSSANQVVLPVEETRELNNEPIMVTNKPVQEESTKNSSRSARVRSTGKIIGIVLLTIVGLVVVLASLAFGAAAYVGCVMLGLIH
jgi:hypothetical protein